MARITDTPLFRNVAPFIKSITKKQLVKELAIVKRCAKKGFNPFLDDSETLSKSFIFRNTPQGVMFWWNLHTEYRTNKR